MKMIMKYMYAKFLLGLALFSYAEAYSQTANSYWATLAKVRYETKKDTSGMYTIEYPVFSQEVLSLDGREINLKGYIIPLEELRAQNFFVLSSLPFSMCYFCGGAGPETVIEVHTTEPIPFTEKAITIKGKFKINPNDPEHLMYMLYDTVLLQK